MKKIFVIALIMALMAGAFGSFSPARAQARTASWVVSVTYQNVGDVATAVNVDFYTEGDSTPISFDPLGGGSLAAGAGASFFIGNVSGLADGYRGNAVMSSSEPLVATVVQFSQTVGFKMRLLSNGFQGSDGAEQYLIASTLFNKFSRTTVFSVQNTGGTDVTATVRLYDADNAGTLASEIDHVIPAYSSKFIDMDQSADTGLGAGVTVFNGSAIVTVPTGNSVVSVASELYTNRNVAANFEGIPLSRTANSIYLATALCRQFGLDTFYAVQNASLTTDASITVTYKNLDGTTKATDGPYDIGPGQKKSITTCAPSSGTSMAGFTGSAIVESVGAPIAVIGKAQCSTAPGICPTAQADVFTAFLGEVSGASKLAMPFVRYANDTNFNAASNTGGKQRSFIAIQNLESTSIDVNVKYYDKLGALVATHPLTIAGFSKGNSSAALASALGLNGMNPGEFGYYTDGSFGGAVIVEAGAANPTAEFIAIVRVQHPGAGEDYNAVPVP
jgi:hypothetical protein